MLRVLECICIKSCSGTYCLLPNMLKCTGGQLGKRMEKGVVHVLFFRLLVYSSKTSITPAPKNGSIFCQAEGERLRDLSSSHPEGFFTHQACHFSRRPGNQVYTLSSSIKTSHNTQYTALFIIPNFPSSKTAPVDVAHLTSF